MSLAFTFSFAFAFAFSFPLALSGPRAKGAELMTRDSYRDARPHLFAPAPDVQKPVDAFLKGLLEERDAIPLTPANLSLRTRASPSAVSRLIHMRMRQTLTQM